MHKWISVSDTLGDTYELRLLWYLRLNLVHGGNVYRELLYIVYIGCRYNVSRTDEPCGTEYVLSGNAITTASAIERGRRPDEFQERRHVPKRLGRMFAIGEDT